jgi:hypothetical protein
MVYMRWYNPMCRVEEEVPAPMSEAQALELLSEHPNSGEFIEEYRRKRTSRDIVEALIHTGECFYWENQREQSPE